MEFQHLGNCQSVSAKVVQLQEVINIRFGVMLMGEAGAGKTTCYRLLKEARTRLQQQNPEAGSKYSRVEEKVVNPKSVTMG